MKNVLTVDLKRRGVMANKVGKLIKKARTDAGLTQEELARKVKGVSASDISKAERGEIRLTNEALKKIAKVTGVTQKSLTDAAASSTYSKQGKTSTTKPKQSSSTKPKQSSSTASKSSMQVTATEKKLVQLYRKADADSKKKAMAALKGTEISDVVESFIGNAIDSLFKK